MTKKTRRGQLFGQPRNWIEFSDKENEDLVSAEIIIDISSDDALRKVHIFTTPVESAVLDKLFEISATAEVKKDAE